jgi:hypothetical protein
MSIEDQQNQFIWLAHVENRSFADISKELNVSRDLLSQWELSLKPQWKVIADIKKIYSAKEIKEEFRVFYEWFKEIEKDKKCFYCGITEEKIKALFDKNILFTKRTRGKKLELDRKDPNPDYNDKNNIVFACYWCNNAKTDTFTADEFKDVGEVFRKIWEKRLSLITNNENN